MKRIMCCVLSVVMAASVIAVSGCKAEEKKKPVGSRDTAGYSVDMPVYETAEELSEESDLIVVGIAKEPADFEERLETGSTIPLSRFVFEVSEVIKGDKDTKQIYVIQTGKHDSDDMETKLKAGEEYILFLVLQSFRGEPAYYCVGGEQGIFRIEKNGRIYSYYDTAFGAKANGSKVTDFKAQIEQAEKSAAAEDASRTEE